ncbi:MAG: hypothetical protein MAG451_01741 [Anaerolineales bacterium]|nr:hypothetical protein [Anaerolineales bacterium]
MSRTTQSNLWQIAWRILRDVTEFLVYSLARTENSMPAPTLPMMSRLQKNERVDLHRRAGLGYHLPVWGCIKGNSGAASRSGRPFCLSLRWLSTRFLGFHRRG